MVQKRCIFSRKIAVLGFLSLTACQYIPGTDEHKMKEAEIIAAKDLIDPSSAQFRDLEVNNDTVCGEINAKNRMGAYVGFKRFFARIESKYAMIDPQFDLGDKLSADDLCSSMRNNPYGYSSSISACERAAEKGMEEIAQKLFDLGWAAECTDKVPTSVPSASTPSEDGKLRSNANPSYIDEQQTIGADMDMEERPVADAETPTSPSFNDADPDPLPEPSLQASDAEEDRQWIDEALGRKPAPAENTVHEITTAPAQ